MIDPTLPLLRQWATSTNHLTQEILFIPAFNNGEEHLNKYKSQIKLIALLHQQTNTPHSCKNAVLELRQLKAVLEHSLIRHFKLKDNYAINVNLEPVTHQECLWAIHKNGNPGFLLQTVFYSLNVGEDRKGYFGANFDPAAWAELKVEFKIIEQCQYFRYKFVHVNSFGDGAESSLNEQINRLPDNLLRNAAQLYALEMNTLGADAQDPNRGLEYIHSLLSCWDDKEDVYKYLNEKVTIRNGSSGLPLEPEDLLLVHEVLAHRAMVRILSHIKSHSQPIEDSTDTPPGILSPWLHHLLDHTSKLPLSVSGFSAKTNQKTDLYDIEELYTTLRSNNNNFLADLIPIHRLLVIHGKAGAGKTTFLKLVAAMLARDQLGIPCPDGYCWRERYLGPSWGNKLWLPLFLRLSELATFLENNIMTDDLSPILNLFATGLDKEDSMVLANYWNSLLDRGEALLLFDGLDDALNNYTREKVINFILKASDRWPKANIIITSRPSGVWQLLQKGFEKTEIQPFGQAEIHRYINLWVTALGMQDGRDSVESLNEAIMQHTPIRRLADNPFMLTCLCVVHWHEQKLPEGRGLVYRAVIKWLLDTKSPKRSKAGYPGRFAHEAFAKLALEMMILNRQTPFDEDEGAFIVKPLVKRFFPMIILESGLINKGREWLQFEPTIFTTLGNRSA